MALAVGFGIAFSGYASAVIQVGIDKLLDVQATRYSNNKFGSDDDLEKVIRTLRRMMTTISNFLYEFSGANDKGVQLWLRELRDIAFRADKLIDELHAMFLEDSIGRNPTNLIGELFSTEKTRQSGMVKEISNFVLSSQEILKERNDLEEFIQRDRTVRNFGRTMAQTSTFVLDPHDVFGREGEKQGILQIIGSNYENQSLSVIPILGMAGIGKTTLARYVFTDSEIDLSFETKSWISLGVEFDLKEITLMILESITGHTCKISSLYKLQDILHTLLKRKKFLIVLDGVWNENQDDWNKLLGPLHLSNYQDTAGSVVLLTTQSPKVASTFGTTEILHLDSLPLEDCQSIFWKQAFKEEHLCEDQELQDIGREIIKKCRGIPVLAKTFGNLLWMKKKKIEWKFILECDIYHLPDVENEVLLGLRLSYSMFPVHLQPYIAYCAIFPRGHKLEKYTLIQMWMAEELVKPSGRVRMEDVGSLCFEELVDRSFFDPTNEPDVYTINWLMYDMLQLVAGDDAFKALVDLSSNESPTLNESLVRYLFVEYNETSEGLERFERFKKFERFEKFKNLRFFSLLFTAGVINHILPDDMMLSMQFIRVLNLSGSGITMLPASIWRLKYLRYLDLSNTQISKIFELLCEHLVMLQTLKLRGCSNLKALPDTFWKLYNMRALEIDAETLDLPPHIGNLTMLQELKVFAVLKQNGYTLCELQNLVELHGALCIKGIENVGSLDEASKASLQNKEHLSGLQLQWSERQDQSENEEEILKNLLPHHNLKQLTITGYLVHKLPNWEWSSPSNLVEVKLIDCVNLRCIEQLNNLKSLKILTLGRNTVVEEINNDFFGLRDDNIDTAFCSLETINLQSWSVLTRWITLHRDAFKLLDKVAIHSCPVLETVPDFDRFRSLKILDFAYCEQLRFSQGGCPRRIRLLFIHECPHLGRSTGPRGALIWRFLLNWS